MRKLLLMVVYLVTITFLVISCSSSVSTPQSPSSATPSPAGTTPVKSVLFKFGYTMPKSVSTAKGFDWFGPELRSEQEGVIKSKFTRVRL